MDALTGTAGGNAAADEVALDRILAGSATASPPAAETAAPAKTATPARTVAPAKTAAPQSPTGSGQPAGPSAQATDPPATAPPATPNLTTAPTDAPATADGPVPAGLRPDLADARTVLPDPYNDGCHVETLDVTSPACVYGDPNGATTIVLFGDSHALSWWPAVDRIATDRGWRFVSLTKSACSSVDVPQWKDDLKRVYTECAAWRANSLARIAAEHPAIVILANSRQVVVVQPDGTPITGAAEIAAWEAGLARTVARLEAIGGTSVVVLGDTPRSAFDVPVCLSQHPDSIIACSTPFDQAVSPAWTAAAAAVAQQADATFVDPTAWVCPSRPCPPVIGNFMVFRDQHHLARPFAAALASRLGAALPDVAAP